MATPRLPLKNLQPKRNPAWPFWYTGHGDSLVCDDFGNLVEVVGQWKPALKYAREGLSDHFWLEMEGPLQ